MYIPNLYILPIVRNEPIIVIDLYILKRVFIPLLLNFKENVISS